MFRLVILALLVASALAGASSLNNTVMYAYFGSNTETLPQITFMNNEYKTVTFNWVFTSLQEYDTNGNVVWTNALPGLTWYQTGPNQVDGNVTVSNVANETTIVAISTQLYGSKTTYKHGGVPLYVPADGVRWGLTVTNWTFANPKNTLVLKGRVVGTIDNNGTTSSTNFTEGKTIGSYPSAFIGDNKKHLLWAQFAKEAVYQERNQDVHVYAGPGAVNTTIEFNVTFAAFNGTVVYNSAVSFQENDNPSSGGSNVVVYVVVAVVCGAIIVIVIAVVIVLFLRRKRASYEEV